MATPLITQRRSKGSFLHTHERVNDYPTQRLRFSNNLVNAKLAGYLYKKPINYRIFTCKTLNFLNKI